MLGQGRQPTWPIAITGSDHGSVLVELFGPAACGKTTLARAVETALGAGGVPVRLVASSRPQESGPTQAQLAAVVTAPLSRAFKLFAALGALTSPADPLERKFMEMLPPKGWMGQLRVRRYLRNLFRSWDAARKLRSVVIFDQGFMNALCSMALYSDLVDREVLRKSIALLPTPDVLVRVGTPRDILTTRLTKRLQRQGPIERLFERKIEVALRQVEIFSQLDELLIAQGRSFLHVCGQDHEGLEKAVGTIVDEVFRRRESRRELA